MKTRNKNKKKIKQKRRSRFSKLIRRILKSRRSAPEELSYLSLLASHKRKKMPSTQRMKRTGAL